MTMPPHHDPSYDQLDELTQADDDSFFAAIHTLEAWLRLPKSRRDSLLPAKPASLAVVNQTMILQIPNPDPAAKQLLDTAFLLLNTLEAKTNLAQKGAEMALSNDDATALKIFMGLGARIDLPLKKERSTFFERANKDDDESEVDKAMAYQDRWRETAVHYCARNELFQCLAVFEEQGLVAAHAKNLAPLLREPEVSGLRQIDQAFLTQHLGKKTGKKPKADSTVLAMDGATDGDIDSEFGARSGTPTSQPDLDHFERQALQSSPGIQPGAQSGAQSETAGNCKDHGDVEKDIEEALDLGHELILALLGATASQSEHLSLSLCMGSVLQGNPLFVSLDSYKPKESSLAYYERWNRHQDTASRIDDVAFNDLMDKMAVTLFEPHLQSHQAAMLHLALKSPIAARMAHQAGLLPPQAGRSGLDDYQHLICNPKGLFGLEPELQTLCKSWIQQPHFVRDLFKDVSKSLIHEMSQLKPSTSGASSNGSSKSRQDTHALGRVLQDMQTLLFAKDLGFDNPSPDMIKPFSQKLDLELIDAHFHLPKELYQTLKDLGEKLATVTLAKKSRVLKA